MIAHAPILSIVRRSRAQRFFCAVVPFDMIAAAVRPTDTPIAVTMPGEHLQSSMIGSSVNPPPPPLASVALARRSRSRRSPLAPLASSRRDPARRSRRRPSRPCRRSCTACAAGRTAAGRRARAPPGAGGSRCRRSCGRRRGPSGALRTIRTFNGSLAAPSVAPLRPHGAPMVCRAHLSGSGPYRRTPMTHGRQGSAGCRRTGCSRAPVSAAVSERPSQVHRPVAPAPRRRNITRQG